VVFSTEPIMQRFMDPQHQVILQLWKSQAAGSMIFVPSSEICGDSLSACGRYCDH
jgi:hypothetical protein